MLLTEDSIQDVYFLNKYNINIDPDYNYRCVHCVWIYFIVQKLKKNSTSKEVKRLKSERKENWKFDGH